MQVIQAPAPWARLSMIKRVFLAGSIEMGKAEPWQDRLVEKFKNHNVDFLNPRRADWDSSWVQKITNPQFREQVEWELEGLLWSDLVVVYFDPTTKSPITLLELGLLIGHRPNRVVVCCPEGFWRKGNVDIICNKFYVNQVSSFEEIVIWLDRRL